MKNELTIEHIGRRIGKDLKLQHSIDFYLISLDDNLSINIPYCKAGMFMPILRPLSDLTKPITHKGETFVPAIKIHELRWESYGKFPKVIDVVKVGNKIELQIEETDFNSATHWRLDLEFKNMPYWMIQKLLEWHFVIDEPDGTWIDVNTLERNCYERLGV